MVAILGLIFIFTTNCTNKNDDNNSNPTPGTIKDIDGNIYHTVTIGTQIWMVENLRTTRNNDGTSIPLVTDSTLWSNLSTPGYCWYNNDALTYKNNYGALYNWYEVNTGKLAPKGWHVPTDDEWTILANYLGGDSIAAGKMKETGSSHWFSPNFNATNESGFTAIPGGYHDIIGGYGGMHGQANFWSTTESIYGVAWCRGIVYYKTNLERGLTEKGDGLSVRCLKD
jgi:uncharacterized protein (TIGR02145 family)